MGQIIIVLCKRKGIEIIEAEACPDHIHMLIRIPPKYSASKIMGYLRGKSALMILEKHANLKYKYGNQHFWCRGYYVDKVGKNTAAIKKYIEEQLKEDLQYDQMTLVECIDSFTCDPVKKNKKRPLEVIVGGEINQAGHRLRDGTDFLLYKYTLKI